MRALASAIQKTDTLDICQLLTLLLLLMHGSEALQVSVPISVLAILGCLFPSVRRSPRLWFLLAAVLVLGSISEWYRLDNHKYLLAYWTVAMFVALGDPHPATVLSFNARALLGLAFLFAALSKAASADYLNGSFFEFALLFDDRFRDVANSLGGITAELQAVNDAAHDVLTNYDSSQDQVLLKSTSAAWTLAQLITIWTIVIEAVLAVLFLFPARRGLAFIRDYTLLLFIASVYMVAPVLGFGWLLAILGLAQVDEGRPHVKALYVLAILLLQVYRLPLSAILPM